MRACVQGGPRLFHCIESVITLCARAPEKVILNLASNGVGYIGVNRLCHGVTNLLNVKGIMKNNLISNHAFVECQHNVSGL